MKIRSLLIALCISFLSFLLAQEEETKYFSNEDEVSFELTREYYLKHYGKNNPLNITLTQFSVGQFPIIQTWNSVTDQIGNSIIGLSADDFMVTENGINAPFSVQQIEGTQSAISVALVIDVSGSMGSSGMAWAKQAALTFVSNMSNFDRAAIIKFASNASVVQTMTSNKTLLTNAINSLSHGGGTAMYDGFYLGLQQLAPESGTKALIGFTDGNNNAGSHNLNSVVNYAIQLSAPIFAIGVGSANATPLQQMANATGGSYYYAPNPSQIGAIYEQISQSIQEQYKIVFNSPNPQLDGTTRLVEISANHNGNSAMTSFTYNAPLDDPNSPVIQLTQSTINLINNSQVEGNPMTISAIITDDQSIASAKLFYKNSNVAFYQDVNLTNTSGNTFEFTIPGNEVVEGAINFYFTASDNEGNSVSLPSLQPFDYPFSISILPNMPPEIVHEAISYAAVGKVIEISAVVTDNTGDLASVMVFYKNHDVPVYSMINMQPVGKGTYTAQLPEVTDAHYNLTSPIDQRNGIDYVIKAEDEYGAISYFPNDFNLNSEPVNIEIVYALSLNENYFEIGNDNWSFANSYSNCWPENWWNQFSYTPPVYPILWQTWPMNAKSYDFPDWSLFTDAYGNDACYYNPPPGIIIYKPKAVSLWRSLVNGNKAYDKNGNLIRWWGGSCYGFAISSLLSFDHREAYEQKHPELGNYSFLSDLPLNNATRKNVNLYWIYQFDKDVFSNIKDSRTKNPNTTLSELKSLLSNHNGNNRALVLYNQNGSGGHAVVPYKVRRDFENIDFENILVYDNNAPTQDDRVIQINKSNDWWNYNLSTNANLPPTNWGGVNAHKGLFLDLESNHFLSNPIRVDSILDQDFSTKSENDYLTFFFSQSKYSKIVNDENEYIQFEDSIVQVNMNNSFPIIPILGRSHKPIGYYVPYNNYLIEKNFDDDNHKTITVLIEDNILYNISLTQDQSSIKEQTNIFFELNDGAFKVFGNSTNSSSEFQGILETEDFSYDYQISNFSIHSGDSVSIMINSDYSLKFHNNSSVKEDKFYKIRFNYYTPNYQHPFEASTVPIGFNTIHTIWPVIAENSVEKVMVFVDDNNNGIVNDTIVLLNEVSSGSQLVYLSSGWSLISSVIQPDNSALEDLFINPMINGSIVIMLSESGVFWPGQNINTIGNWNPYDGYKIKMNVADQIVITGEEVIDKTANLSIGANFLPVLSPESVSAITIFDQIEDELLFAFDMDGFIYWPDGGIYDLQLLEPGKAYLLSMTADASVTFPESGGGKQLTGNKLRVVENSPWEVTNTGNPHIISIFEAALADLKQGDIIAAFNTEGVCVGVTQFAGEAGNLPLVVYGNDLTTELVDGLVEGEAITLKIYDPLAQNVTEVYPVWDNKMPNNGQFTENGLSAIMSLKAGTSVAEHSLSNLSIYPNPNTGAFNVTGINEPVEIHVVNTTGQVIEQFNTDQSIEINLSGFAKGIYYLKVVSETNIRVEKIIIR